MNVEDMDIEEMLNDKDHVITDPYVRTLLEKKLIEQKFFGLKPVKFDEKNKEILEPYVFEKKE